MKSWHITFIVLKQAGACSAAQQIQALRSKPEFEVKTDAIDAKLLARFGVEREHRPWNPAELVIKRMRDFSRYRVQLQEQKTAIANILHSKDYAHGVPADIKKSSKKVIAVLEKEIAILSKEMEKVVKSDRN
ncbi:MAG: transposase [Flavobacteriales bacterium]|nr:transposase [Flavobacteriales bacterium]